LVGFVQNQIIASPKAFDLLRLCTATRCPLFEV